MNIDLYNSRSNIIFSNSSFNMSYCWLKRLWCCYSKYKKRNTGLRFSWNLNSVSKNSPNNIISSYSSFNKSSSWTRLWCSNIIFSYSSFNMSYCWLKRLWCCYSKYKKRNTGLRFSWNLNSVSKNSPNNIISSYSSFNKSSSWTRLWCSNIIFSYSSFNMSYCWLKRLWCCYSKYKKRNTGLRFS